MGFFKQSQPPFELVVQSQDFQALRTQVSHLLISVNEATDALKAAREETERATRELRAVVIRLEAAKKRPVKQ